MPTYLIERTVPGAGQMDEAGLAGIAGKSNDVLSGLGPNVRWLPSYVTDDDVKYIAGRLDMRVNEVEEVVTFYTMYSRKPIGKYKLQVCRTLSCWLRGAEEITERIEHKLGCGIGETTPDGKFTLVEVECLGYCDLAPCMQVNFDYHEKVTPERVDEIIAGLS